MSELNGYCHHGFVFQLEEALAEDFCLDATEFLMGENIPFLFEEFNLKDTWWGSLPGLYLANITPPLLGLPSIESLLCHTEVTQEAERQHRFQHLLDTMDKGKPEKGVELEYVQDGSVSS